MNDERDIVNGDSFATVMRKVIRSAQGGQQGCVLATNGCCLPYHLSLCRTQRQFRAAEILCQADDTYMRHPRRVGVGGTEQTAADAFERLQTNRLEDCGCVSNDAKIKAICPAGGVDGIPAAAIRSSATLPLHDSHNSW